MTQSPLPKQNTSLPKNPKVHDFKARFGVVPDTPPPKMTRLQARRAKRKRFRAGMIAFSVMLGVAGGSAFLIAQDFQGFARFFKSSVTASEGVPKLQAATPQTGTAPQKKIAAAAPAPVPEAQPQAQQQAETATVSQPAPEPDPQPEQQVAADPGQGAALQLPPPTPPPEQVAEADVSVTEDETALAAAEPTPPPAPAAVAPEPAVEPPAEPETVAAAEPEAAAPPAPESSSPPPAVATAPVEKLVFPAAPVVASDGSNLNAPAPQGAPSQQPAANTLQATAVPQPNEVVVEPASAPPESQAVSQTATQTVTAAEPAAQVAMATPAVQAAPAPVATIKPEDTSSLLQGQVFRDCENCPDLVVVVPPAGLPPEQVARVKRPDDAPPLTAYAIGRFEITFDDWARCMAGGGCTSQPSDEAWGRNTRPVINVSHDEAVNQYIAWLSRATGAAYRLPSSAEWDFAEAGGGVVPASGVPLIDSQTICQSGNYVAATPTSQEAGCSDGFPATAPVGSFKANSLGLSDMRGNVWEWVSDCWTPGFTYKVKDSERDCRKRLLKGGSWTSRALLSSTPARGFELAQRASKSIGFRVARALP